jgi:PAS domain S-box-containing protein
VVGLREFLDNLSQAELVDRLNLALDGASLGIWDWDLRDDSVQFDRRWCEMLGLDHETTPMNLQTWSERVHPDDLEGCFVDIRAHVEGKTSRYENVHRMRHADGRWVYILDRGRISGRDEQGKPLRFTGTHFDVTMVEQARRVLAEQERQLRDLVENLPTGVVMLDRELRVLAASAPWRRHESTLDESVGRRFAESARNAEHWEPLLARALAGEQLGEEEQAMEDTSGKQRHHRWDARPWRTLDGTIGGVLLSVEDVTERVERRRAEEREREARIASLALFAGGIAHEINSPLQIILTEVELLQLDRSDLSARVAESIDSIDKTVRRAATIARALRNFARDARTDPLGLVDLAEVLRDVDALCRKRLESSGITLTVGHLPERLTVVGRSAELIHILLNLVSNAGDAAAGGDRWVRVEVAESSDAARVRVVDGGRGIAPSLKDRVLEPFFTTKEPGRGTGLGLSIADTLARRNQASLTLADGEPTTFVLALTRAPSRR